LDINNSSWTCIWKATFGIGCGVETSAGGWSSSAGKPPNSFRLRIYTGTYQDSAAHSLPDEITHEWGIWCKSTNLTLAIKAPYVLASLSREIKVPKSLTTPLICSSSQKPEGKASRIIQHSRL
jgi:hypothetical protein